MPGFDAQLSFLRGFLNAIDFLVEVKGRSVLFEHVSRCQRLL